MAFEMPEKFIKKMLSSSPTLVHDLIQWPGFTSTRVKCSCTSFRDHLVCQHYTDFFNRLRFEPYEPHIEIPVAYMDGVNLTVPILVKKDGRRDGTSQVYIGKDLVGLVRNGWSREKLVPLLDEWMGGLERHHNCPGDPVFAFLLADPEPYGEFGQIMCAYSAILEKLEDKCITCKPDITVMNDPFGFFSAVVSKAKRIEMSVQ